MTKNQEKIAKIDELLAKKEEQRRLLRELRELYVLADLFGVDANDIARSGYDQARDQRWQKWPNVLRAQIKPEPNYLILRDGRRVEREIDWQTELARVKAERIAELREPFPPRA